MPRGGRKPGVKFGGRKKGTPNKHKQSFRDALRVYCAALGVDPHRFMAQIIADQAADLALRFNAARELAQYVEPKLKAVELRGDVEQPLQVIFRYGRGRDHD